MGLAGVDLAACLLRFLAVVKLLFVMAGWKDLPEMFAVPGRIGLAMSALLTGVIAFDRYDSICRPHKRLLNQRRAKGALLVSFIGAVLIETPDFLYLTNSPARTSMRKLSHVAQINQYLAVLLAVLVCYGKVYVTIRKHARVQIRAASNVPTVSTISRRNISRPNLKSQVVQVPPESLSSSSTSKPAPRSDRPMLSTSKKLMSQTPPEDRQLMNPSTSEVPPKSSPAETGAQQQRSTTQTDTNRRTLLRQRKSGNLPPMRKFMQRKVTRMLFITSVVFLATWLPYWTFVAADLHVLNGGQISDGVLGTLFGASVLVPFNSIVNPAIYGLANRRFRKDCALVLNTCRCC